MRCQPGRRTLLFSLSVALDSDLTAKLSLALRAARVKIRCPSEAAVRAGNLCGGVPLTAEPLQPTPQGGRHPGPGRRWASPRRLAASRARHTMSGVSVHQDLIEPQAVPLPLRGEGLSAPFRERDEPCRVGHFPCPGERSVTALLDRGRTLPFTSAGGAKPIAARERDAGHLVGWVGGVPR